MEQSIRPSYQIGDTIAAIATPPGEGGIAIIRISGNNALDVAEKIFSGPVKTYKSHTVHLGKIVDERLKVIDEALVLVMLGKRSFCGEDTVEIHCHGGNIVSRKVLETAIRAGARTALPGEFSFKAFMNGKMDLIQAEAVQELIKAKNEMSLQAAERHLQGKLSQRISTFQKNLTDVAAALEAWIDFPEEDLPPLSVNKIRSSLENAKEEMEKLLETFHNGKIISEGLKLCLAGSPNVGKSSLMNTLLDKERAIVTHIPGTTRDILEDSFRLNDLNICLTDTAGIRESNEIIEAEGIRRSKKAIEESDLILLVLDSQRGLQEKDKELLEKIPRKKSIAVWNKTDLPHPKNLPSLPLKHVLKISAKKRTGIEDLQKSIEDTIWRHSPPSDKELTLTNFRHKEALSQSLKFCKDVLEGLQMNASPEFLAIDIRQCLNELGKIIGRNVSEDILTSIFSTFCIGK